MGAIVGWNKGVVDSLSLSKGIWAPLPGELNGRNGRGNVGSFLGPSYGREDARDDLDVDALVGGFFRDNP